MPEGPLYTAAKLGDVEASEQLCRQTYVNFQSTTTSLNPIHLTSTLPPLAFKCASLQTQEVNRLLASGIHPDDKKERDSVSLP